MIKNLIFLFIISISLNSFGKDKVLTKSNMKRNTASSERANAFVKVSDKYILVTILDAEASTLYNRLSGSPSKSAPIKIDEKLSITEFTKTSGDLRCVFSEGTYADGTTEPQNIACYLKKEIP